MTDILNLPGWKATASRQDDDEYVIEAEYTVQPTICPKCGVIGTPYKHGTKVVAYRDKPVRCEPTSVLANVQRYRCRDCGETFLQPLDGIQPNMRMTARCAEYIKTQCLSDTFVRIAQNIGCDDKTVRDLAGEHITALNLAFKPHLPEWLGIDETQIDGKLRCIITDVVNRKPVDMLPDRDKVSVTNWLNQFRERRTVKGLAIDMWRPYKDAAEIVFPGLPVVVDKFHLVKMANKAMDDIRISLAKDQDKAVGKDWMRRKALLRLRYKSLDEKGRFSLGMWLDNEPGVKTAYDLKEAFYDIYDATTKAEASKRLDAWRESVPASMKKGKKSFAPLLTSTRNWRVEMLAVFDYPITNGYTEALNGVAKVINRQGRGYSFEVLRARLLFGQTTFSKPRKKGQRPIVSRTLAQTAAHAMLVKAFGGRCESCGGIFPPEDIESSIIPPIIPGQHTKSAYLCEDCHARFHTGEGDGDVIESTL